VNLLRGDLFFLSDICLFILEVFLADSVAKFKLPGFRQWLDIVSEETAQAVALEIVSDLKRRGPYWSGEFEEN
jgi:hypothetical protein